ncbi:MAG TPA: AMP-binding protein [Lacunisphaera sp.]|nr:AMP-binding protein [Lacunisphaera sp.]
MAAFTDAVAGKGDVFLCDPNWGSAEKAQVEALLESAVGNQPPESNHGWLMIPTGGSSGRVQFARHDQDTMATAVQGFTGHFGLAVVNAVGTLPLHHVSGLMAWMRSVLTGGEYRSIDWKALERGERPALEPRADGWVISLVPTQLERLLRDPGAVVWLKSLRVIFLGGAPAWRDLLDRASAHRLPLSLGYGMTETAAMAAAVRPEEWLAGDRTSGRPLPHVHLAIGKEGMIELETKSLFRGYYPEYTPLDRFVTSDLGRLDDGRLVVLGRRDSAINTGGEKVQPAEIEAALRATGEFDDVAVFGLPNPEWGQMVVAAYVASHRPDLARVDAILAAQLAPAKRPRRFVALSEMPRTAAGKLDRAQLARMVEPLSQPHQ